MRITLVLEADVEDLLKLAMQRSGSSLEQAVNDAIRAGIGRGPRRAETTFPVYAMGPPLVDVTKALRLAGVLEDQESIRRLAS